MAFVLGMFCYGVDHHLGYWRVEVISAFDSVSSFVLMAIWQEASDDGHSSIHQHQHNTFFWQPSRLSLRCEEV